MSEQPDTADESQPTNEPEQSTSGEEVPPVPPLPGDLPAESAPTVVVADTAAAPDQEASSLAPLKRPRSITVAVALTIAVLAAVAASAG